MGKIQYKIKEEKKYLGSSKIIDIDFFHENKNIGSANLTERQDDITINFFEIKKKYQDNGFGKACVKEIVQYTLKKGKILSVCSRPPAVEFWENSEFKMTDHEPGEVWMRYAGKTAKARNG